MLLPVHHLPIVLNIHHQVLPNRLNLLLAQPNLAPHKRLNPTPPLAHHSQRGHHALAARAHHALRGRAVAPQRLTSYQIRDELLLAGAEAQVRQTVLVRDGGVGDAAQRQDQRDDDASAVLAGRAVDEDRGRRGGREVAKDGGEGTRGRGAREEDARVDFDEAL